MKWAFSSKNLAIWSRSFGAHIPMGQKFCWTRLGSGCPFRAGKPPCGFATVPAIPYCTPSLDSLTDKICLAHIATSVGNPHSFLLLCHFWVPRDHLLLLLARMQKPTCLGKSNGHSVQGFASVPGSTQGKDTAPSCLGFSAQLSVLLHGPSFLVSLASLQTLPLPPDLRTFILS